MQVGAPGRAHGDELGVEGRADAADHLKAEILGALLDAVHGALARAQTLGELGLREATVLTCAADQGSDLRGIHRGDRSGERSFGAGDSHDDDPNSHMRYKRVSS
ncbi:hypothetical protein GCM10010102_01210 [Promicromonospora citrea]|uniref:Uncharacterized protein n=1 Tax=Promicromonospora citrea TaxID=43677 RepID=A0A8H9GCF6_9MICO|nr:hypothetical protein GCM10010102_01210 [Promicromonospora citrea]